MDQEEKDTGHAGGPRMVYTRKCHPPGKGNSWTPAGRGAPMNSVTIIIDGLPPTVNHQSTFRRGRFPFKSTKAKEYQVKARVIAMKAMEDAGHNVFTGPCTVQIDYYFPDKRRRDCGNHDKVLLDAMNGVVYEDDKQIGDNSNPGSGYHDMEMTGHPYRLWHKEERKFLDRDRTRVEVRITWVDE